MSVSLSSLSFEFAFFFLYVMALIGQSQANAFLNWFSSAQQDLYTFKVEAFEAFERRNDQISTRFITSCDREYV
jgi:hypothetical protein